MAINNFSTSNTVVTVQGREITDWGETDPPISEAPIDPKSVVRRGLGGNAVRLDRINPGRTVTLSLNPGSPDASFLQGLFNSGANITYSRTVIGSLENAIGDQGAIVNDGTTGRGGQTVTDAVFVFEFNSWLEQK